MFESTLLWLEFWLQPLQYKRNQKSKSNLETAESKPALYFESERVIYSKKWQNIGPVNHETPILPVLYTIGFYLRCLSVMLSSVGS